MNENIQIEQPKVKAPRTEKNHQPKGQYKIKTLVLGQLGKNLQKDKVRSHTRANAKQIKDLNVEAISHKSQKIYGEVFFKIMTEIQKS